ncbi:MAG: hypothetical protein AAFV01_13655, partial [Bacteroidota bacterium]
VLLGSRSSLLIARFTMRFAVLVCVLLGLVSGCAPSVSPLYRDFAASSVLDAASNGATVPAEEALPSTDSPVLIEVASRALERAEWTLAPAPYEATTLRTEARTVSNLGLYRTEVTLEVVPLSAGFVRVHVHPYRHYLVGGRSKLPYLNPGLRRALLPALEEAFEAEGLQMLGTARKRDKTGS